MNQATLEKLRSNPHYKMSEAQKKEAEEIENPFAEFGILPKHDPKLPKHPTLQKKGR